MKFKLKNKKGMVLSLVIAGATVLALNSFESISSENGTVLDGFQDKFAIEKNDDALFLKTTLIKGNGISEDLSYNPIGFAKILDANYKAVATKVRVPYNNKFFNKLKEYIYGDEGMMLGMISEKEWVEFYKDANSQGVEDYLNKTGEHSLIVRLSGTNFINNTLKFVNIDNIKKYNSIEGELQALSKYSVRQYFIEECGKLVFVKDNVGYRKATDEESAIILDLDKELSLETGSKMALKYYKKYDDKNSPMYTLDIVELYNKHLDDMYVVENFSQETLNLIEKIKKGCLVQDVKYREVSNLYDYNI